MIAACPSAADNIPQRYSVVIVTAEYPPNPSALGVCMQGIVDCLHRDAKLSVQVISTKHEASSSTYDTDYGYPVTRVLDRRALCLQRLRSKADRTQGPVKCFFSVAAGLWRFYVRAHRYLSAHLRPVNIYVPLVRAYLAALHDLPQPADMIVATCLPAEAVEAARQYCQKNPDTAFVPYFFDPFADNASLQRTALNLRCKFKRHIQCESAWLERCKKALLVKHVRPHYQKFHALYEDRFIILEQPTLYIRTAEAKTNEVRDTRNRDRVPTLVYTGSVVKKIRPPEQVIRLLIELADKLPMQAHFYTMGNATPQIDALARQHNDCIFSHGYVPKSEADRALMEADILLSIGNLNRNQSPSKLFEYIGTGKPIIHLAFHDDDVAEILARYPLAHVVSLSRSDRDRVITEIADFIRKVTGQSVPAAKLTELYPEALPTYTADKIAAIIFEQPFYSREIL